MKKTQLITKLLFLLAIGVYSPLAMAQTAEKNDGEKTSQTPAAKSIVLSQRETGWRISVKPDGSGTAAYGSTALDVFSFPKGTVSFEELLTTVKTKALVPHKDPLSVDVLISVVGEATPPKRESRALATDWNLLWATIVPHLKSAPPERLAKLLEQQDPALKIPPQPAPPQDEKTPAPPKK